MNITRRKIIKNFLVASAAVPLLPVLPALGAEPEKTADLNPLFTEWDAAPPVPGVGTQINLTWCSKQNKLYAMRDGHCYQLADHIDGSKGWLNISAYIHKGKYYFINTPADMGLFLDRLEIS